MASDLTDDQLRKELIALGVKNLGPITKSTRGILEKKLNHLRARKISTGRGTASKTISKKLLGFSSDESENESNKPSRSSTRSTRRTSRVSSKRTHVADRDNDKPEAQPVIPSPALARPSLRKRRSTPVPVKNPRPNAGNTSYVWPSPRAKSTRISNVSRRSEIPSTSLPYSRETQDDDIAFEQNSESFHFDHDLTSTHDQFEFSDSDGDVMSFDEDLSQSSRGDSMLSGPEMVNVAINTSESLDLSQPYSPNSSTFMTLQEARKRASPAVGNKTWLRTLYQKNNYSPGVGQDINNKHLDNESNSLRMNEDELSRQGFKVKEDHSSYNRYSQYISTFLVVLAALFFILLGALYLQIGTQPESDESKVNLMYCQDDNADVVGHTIECFSKEQVKGAAALITDLTDIARARAGLYDCGYTEGRARNISMKEARQLLQMKYGIEFGLSSIVSAKRFDLYVAIKLISVNPQWKISLLDEDGNVIHDINKYNLERVISLESEVPWMSFTCRIYKALWSIFNKLILVFVAAGFVTLIILSARYHWQKKRRERQEVYDLVEKIINVLKTHHDESQEDKDMDSFLAIPHVRDMLLPANQRKRKQHIWDKAVQFLAANESRVRVETEVIQGEEFAVWRWLQTTSKGSKVWQGQAFGEHGDSTMTSPPYSLTPCLKIRNMFNLDSEFGENWQVRIQDAILEKCRANYGSHGVVHVAVDQSSQEGCVYVKCTDTQAAGRAFKALHGWWFDGRLVTVKYLRLERYHERFPDAVRAINPLQPSNNQKLSLSQPFHRSFIETT